MKQMSFTAFLGHAGLWLTDEKAGDKLRQIKALTPEDKAWFVDRAKIEFGVEIISVPAAS